MPNPSSTKDFMLGVWGRLWDFVEGVSSSYNDHDVITMTFLNSSLNIASCIHVPMENKKNCVWILKWTASFHRTNLPRELQKASFKHLAGASNVIAIVTGKENCGIRNSIRDYLAEITRTLLVGRPHECWYSFIRVAIWDILLNEHTVCVITSVMLQSLSLALIINFTFINKFSELWCSYFRHVWDITQLLWFVRCMHIGIIVGGLSLY